MANPNQTRICRLHELKIRNERGHTRAFRFGEVVELTPDLIEALGDYLESSFEPIAAPSQGNQAETAKE